MVAYTLVRRGCAVLLLVAGLGGILQLDTRTTAYPPLPGFLIAAAFLEQAAFLALGSYLLHAPIEAAFPLRCGSLLLTGYLTAGLGLFGLWVGPQQHSQLLGASMEAMTGSGLPYDGHVALSAARDTVSTLLLVTVPLLLPRPDRRQTLIALACLALGLSLRAYTYGPLLRP